MNDNSIDLKALVNGCKQGDRNSQRKVYEYLYRSMLAVSLRYMGNKDDAKDILHEGFIKVFNGIDKYNDSGSFEGWVRRIIANTAIDAIRKINNQKTLVNSDIVEIHEHEEEENFNWFEENQVSPQVIFDEIQNLTPAYRTVFNMYVIEGYTHNEIAEYLNISVGASKSNLSKAKARLKERLTERIEMINS